MVFNSDQSIALIAGDEDVIFADIKDKQEIGKRTDEQLRDK